MLTEVRLVQPSNVLDRFVTPSGILTEVRLVQPWNA